LKITESVWDSCKRAYTVTTVTKIHQQTCWISANNDFVIKVTQNSKLSVKTVLNNLKSHSLTFFFTVLLTIQ